jgi:hypothetical protein
MPVKAVLFEQVRLQIAVTVSAGLFFYAMKASGAFLLCSCFLKDVFK